METDREKIRSCVKKNTVLKIYLCLGRGLTRYDKYLHKRKCMHISIKITLYKVINIY